MKPENENIYKAMEYARKLLFLADKGDLQRQDAGCGVLYGVIRDCGYRIRMQAELEKKEHHRLGKWEENEQIKDAG